MKLFTIKYISMTFALNVLFVSFNEGVTNKADANADAQKSSLTLPMSPEIKAQELSKSKEPSPFSLDQMVVKPREPEAQQLHKKHKHKKEGKRN